jgi:ATP-dependent protease ClpP protease subunit
LAKPDVVLNPRRAHVVELLARSRALRASSIADRAPTLRLHGEIGAGRSFSAARVRDFLRRHAAAAAVQLLIDSGGGSVREARAIAAALDMHRGGLKIGKVVKSAHSAAGLVLQACDLRQAVAGATMLLHRCTARLPRPLTGADLSAMAEFVDDADRHFAEAVAQRSRMSSDAIVGMMKRGMMLTAVQAWRLGLLDEVV